MDIFAAVYFYIFFLSNENKLFTNRLVYSIRNNVMTLSFWTDRSEQTVQTQIRLLLEEQSDQGLHCLLSHLRVFDKIP